MAWWLWAIGIWLALMIEAFVFVGSLSIRRASTKNERGEQPPAVANVTYEIALLLTVVIALLAAILAVQIAR